MSRPCKVCVSPAREQIEAALLAQTPYRDITKQHDFSVAVLTRHKEHMAQHLPMTVGEAVEMRREERNVAAGLNLVGILQQVAERLQMVSDACHEWLLDPHDPSRYTLDARANEVKVVYEKPRDDGQGVIRVRETLENLLKEIDDRLGTVVKWETKQADTRELILKTQAQILNMLTFVAGVLEKALAFQEAAARAQAAAEVPEEEARREFVVFYRRHGLDQEVSELMAGWHFEEEEEA